MHTYKITTDNGTHTRQARTMAEALVGVQGLRACTRIGGCSRGKNNTLHNSDEVDSIADEGCFLGGRNSGYSFDISAWINS